MALEKLKARLDELIEKGQRVLDSRKRQASQVYEHADQMLFHEWRAGSLSFLVRAFGSGHTHTTAFEKACTSHVGDDPVKGQAILKAAKEDLDGGYLKSIELLVSADIFTDFLEMAGHLLENGYKDPAASLIGAVLEDGLRRIARNRETPTKPGDDLSTLNQKLAQAQVYNRLTQKRVQVWGDIRNHADHGHFDQYTPELVAECCAVSRTS
jgi:hypothetical protein